VADQELQLWKWWYTDQFRKRRVFPCRLTAEDAKHYKDAERIKGTLEIREKLGSTSDFQTSPKGSWTRE
jgi:hypothetical protein